jgi:predicted XRE-type DNA-binding protein
MTHHITKGSVLDDLGFDSETAANLKIRAALMRAIESEINIRELTQEQAAKILGITQPRVSDLKRGKMHLFTIDALVNMMLKLGKHIDIVIDDRRAA